VRCFGDYELLEQIGRGGMGVVYKARQFSLSRTVALKMIASGEFASPSAVQRFHIEAEAVAKLDHPNIVPIYGLGVHRGQHYFSMKFVEGRNLAEEIRHGKFRAAADTAVTNKASARQRQQAIARLMATVAHSVHYAPSARSAASRSEAQQYSGRCRRQPHLTDFGLAKILEHDVGVTGSKEVMGSPSYMSPEQAAGRRLTAVTDIYSLGVIFYELLTGRPPFCGATGIEVLQQLAQQEPAHPRTVNRHADSDLATICLKCLEKDPQSRYTTASALAEDLERWLRHEPIQARRASMILRTQRWTRRNPAVATLLVVLSAALAGTLLFLDVLRVKDAERERLVQMARDDLKRELDKLWAQQVPLVLISAEHRAVLMGGQTSPAIPGAERRFKFGIYVHKETPTERLAAFAPILNDLDTTVSKRLQQSVRTDFVVFRSYTVAMDALLNGEVDFVRFGASSYVIAKEKNHDRGDSRRSKA
jgi:serine/threonine-protein kinase